MKVRPNLRVILVGGSSHVGKSTLSGSLAAELGWTHVSSDTLARHPGRPWKPEPEKVPDNVAEHYLSLSVDDLLRDVLCHYRVNVWPKVEAIVAPYSNDTSSAGVIVEGSALWPPGDESALPGYADRRTHAAPVVEVAEYLLSAQPSRYPSGCVRDRQLVHTRLPQWAIRRECLMNWNIPCSRSVLPKEG